jgi:hypothetical protein
MACGTSFEGDHCVTNVLREIAEAQHKLVLVNVIQAANNLFQIYLERIMMGVTMIQSLCYYTAVIANRLKDTASNRKN